MSNIPPIVGGSPYNKPEPSRDYPSFHGTETYGERPQPYISQAHMVVAWVLTVMTSLYLLPWAIAATRQKRDTVTIGVITFLLGWTIIGWIWMLIKACNDENIVSN